MEFGGMLSKEARVDSLGSQQLQTSAAEQILKQ